MKAIWTNEPLIPVDHSTGYLIVREARPLSRPVASVPSEPDARLMALAPLMAQTILLEADHHANVSGCELGCETCLTAERIREIGDV